MLLLVKCVALQNRSGAGLAIGGHVFKLEPFSYKVPTLARADSSEASAGALLMAMETETSVAL